jgi:3-oxoadipate enol-lactonase
VFFSVFVDRISRLSWQCWKSQHEPSLFLKQTIPASGLAMFAKTGHILNLEEPALFNETLERFLGLAEAGRWPPRDPASRRV